MLNNDLRINKERLLKRLNQMAQIGKTPKGGVCRLAGSKEDAKARALLTEWISELGWSLSFDEMGNMFMRMKSINPNHDPILVGSHLDSQPTGGNYDGVLGVLAALEAMQSMQEAGIPISRPIELVNWTNEEGARFTPAMLGSGFFAGVFDLDYAWSRTDDKGKTIKSELQQIHWLGKQRKTPNYVATYELHIEQGPILEAEDLQIGIVKGVQGIRWYEITIYGTETHAGPSPMEMRDDPVQKLPALLEKIYDLCRAFGSDSRITVGKLHTLPGSQNTVPSELKFSLDIRHPDEKTLQKMHFKLLSVVSESQKVSLSELWYSPPVAFAESCINAVQKAVNTLSYSHKHMVSGAGHDSVYVAKNHPTAMIFIPCKDGLSHNEAEYAKPEDIEAGANVLLQSLVYTLANH